MADYVRLMTVDRLADGEMALVHSDGRDFLVARETDRFFVADPHCPHLGARLDRGALDGSVVTCPWHGSQFDLVDGRCIRWTAFSGVVKRFAEAIRPPRGLTVFSSRVEDGWVWVEKELADKG